MAISFDGGRSGRRGYHLLRNRSRQVYRARPHACETGGNGGSIPAFQYSRFRSRSDYFHYGARSVSPPMIRDRYVAKKPAHTGRGGWTWYTGSAGWMYRLLTETLLGLNLEGNRLRLIPRLPKRWTSCKIRYRYRQTPLITSLSPDIPVVRLMPVEHTSMEKS